MTGRADHPGEETLCDIEDLLDRVLVREGLQPSTAASLAKAQRSAISHEFGGQLVYVPKGHFAAMRERRSRIVALFTGDNHKELAKLFNVSLKQIYKIIQADRESRSAALREPVDND